jgi:membrane protein implicated in regulation of membrane protease activity
MPDFGTPAMVWVMIAIVSAVIEVSVPHFGMIFASLGAAAAAGTAAVGFGLSLQIVTFVIVLGASLAVLRPRLMGNTSAPGVPSRTEALLGHEGIVTHDIDLTLGAGRVNVGGQDWAARSVTPIAIGTRVRVTGADGIVLEVTPA